MFYEAMEDILPKLKVIIDDGSGNVQKYYPIESFANMGSSTGSASTGKASTNSSSASKNTKKEEAAQ